MISRDWDVWYPHSRIKSSTDWSLLLPFIWYDVYSFDLFLRINGFKHNVSVFWGSWKFFKLKQFESKPIITDNIKRVYLVTTFTPNYCPLVAMTRVCVSGLFSRIKPLPQTPYMNHWHCAFAFTGTYQRVFDSIVISILKTYPANRQRLAWTCFIVQTIL